MKTIFIIIYCVLLSHFAIAQNTFKAIIRNDKTKEVLRGATAIIPDLKIAATGDTSGLIIINNIPNGKFVIEITFVGYNQ